MTRILVLGIGNTLLSDEGIGIHVIDYLRRHHPAPEGVTYLDGGTLSFTLAPEIEDTDHLIVVDAARLGGQPGNVACMTGSEMDHFLGTAKRSVHEVGLLDLLDIARLTETLPANRALVGIQPDIVVWGEQPTPGVSSARPLASKYINDLISSWQQPANKDQHDPGAA